MLKNTLAQNQDEENDFARQFAQLLQQKQFSSQEAFLEYIASEQAIQTDEQVIADYEKEVKANEVQLQSARADAAGKTVIDIEDLERETKQQETKVEALRSQNAAIAFRLQTNLEKYQKMNAQQDNLERYRKEDTICTRLYNLVSGQTGKGKITLEQYIQAAGFDGIIRAANRRLQPMSEGQFELYRQEDSLGKKSNTFLDLEVLDNFTGHRRPVGNLSGGESFKASLSLALGLSDTVSSNLGGVQMDVLFVDEGFGTLDRKSIESAMDILLHLSGTNKLVGIVSHREELTDTIQQQIRVEKGKHGSRISVDLGM
jgi:exonuclease SbcC